MGRRLVAVGRYLVVSGFTEFAIQQLQLLLLQGQLFVQLVDLLVQHINGVVLQSQTNFQFRYQSLAWESFMAVHNKAIILPLQAA